MRCSRPSHASWDTEIGLRGFVVCMIPKVSTKTTKAVAHRVVVDSGPQACLGHIPHAQRRKSLWKRQLYTGTDPEHGFLNVNTASKYEDHTKALGSMPNQKGPKPKASAEASLRLKGTDGLTVPAYQSKPSGALTMSPREVSKPGK